MLTNAVYQKQLAVRGVLMDTWYATVDLMRLEEFPYGDTRQNHFIPIVCGRATDNSSDCQQVERKSSNGS
jgi:hypothetical protein